MSYSELLKDPRWQKKRLEILSRDKFTCVWCNDATKTLHVHHTRYYPDTMPWDYEDYIYETLCDTCHKIRHLHLTELEVALLSVIFHRDALASDITNGKIQRMVLKMKGNG